MDVVIANEKDACTWLERALNGDIPAKEPINLRFDGWPTVKLRFTGRDFDQSVPTRIMPPLLQAQKEIHRLYCQLRYGENNLRKLKDEDREKLELNVKVKKGSSDYGTNLSDVLTQTFQSAVSHMDSVHILIAILGSSVVWGSSAAWKNWLADREKMREGDSRVKLSKLELDKMALIARAVQSQPSVKVTSRGVDNFRNDSLRQLKSNDSFDIPESDFNVSGSHAADITQTEREQSIEVRVDGEFIIDAVMSGRTAGFKLKVTRLLDDKKMTVSIPEEALTHDQKSVLQTNEWNKRPVRLELNAKQLHGQITGATLISAKGLDPDPDPE